MAFSLLAWVAGENAEIGARFLFPGFALAVSRETLNRWRRIVKAGLNFSLANPFAFKLRLNTVKNLNVQVEESTIEIAKDAARKQGMLLRAWVERAILLAASAQLTVMRKIEHPEQPPSDKELKYEPAED